jgi:hypothetical protein
LRKRGNPVSIVHVLLAGQSSEHRLAQQTEQLVATVLTGARIGQHVAPV